MNCPICGSGVMEDAGFILIAPVNDTIQIKFSFEHFCGSEKVKICSLDECGHLETKAAPGSLTTVKRLIRNVVLHHYI